MSLTKRTFCLFITAISLGLAGCMTLDMPTIEPAASWKLPPKESADSAMIIGRIGNKAKEQRLRYVTMQRWGKMYITPQHTPKGEDHYIMDNNYFVVTNLKPDRYYFSGFNLNGEFNGMPARMADLISLKPNQIKFIGSFDYEEGSWNTLLTIAQLPTYSKIIPTAQPTEIDMLRWLLRAGAGSGWEPTIKQRLRELGAKP